jgi:type IX secretion system PorP/SprF family membrane protein
VNKTYVLTLLIFTFFALSLKGQDIHFSSINANDMYLNPAKTAFTNTDFKVATAYRNQWQTVSINGYNTCLFTAEARLLSSKRFRHSLGIGVGFLKDIAGTLDFGQRQMFVNLSYNKQIEKHNNHFISLGIQLSNNYWAYDATNADFGQNQSDWEGILLSNLSYNDLSLGLHWQIEPADMQALAAGIAVFHITQPSLSFIDELNLNNLQLKPRYYAYTNYLFSTSDAAKLQLTLSSSLQNDNYEILLGGEYIVDMATTIFDQNNLGVGAYYRSNDAIILTLKYQFNNINVGLAYDINISGLSQVSNTYGGLEIYLSYGFNKFSYNKKIKTIPCPTF